MGVLESWHVLKYYEELSLNSLSWFNVPKEGGPLYDIDLDTGGVDKEKDKKGLPPVK